VEAAEAGKHIYCEKPLSLNVADGIAMVAAVRKYGVVSQTGSHERSNPQSVFVCEAVKHGLVGDIQRIVAKVGFNNKVGPGPGWKPMPVPPTFDYQRWLGTAPKVPYHRDRCLYRFRFNYDYSGGQITNFGAHSNDMALWGLGMDDGGPTEVVCRSAKFLPVGSLFNTATETVFEAKFASGVQLRCESGPEQVQTRFEGTKGWIQTGYRGTTASNPEWLQDLPPKVDGQGRDALTRHMDDFFDCIRTKKLTRAPFARGHNTATLCHIANVAIKRFPEYGEQELVWDHATMRFTNDDSANELLG
jgi:predicted dehydrogenase